MILLFTIGATIFAVTIVKSLRKGFGKSNYDIMEEEEVLQLIDPSFFN